MAFTPLGVRPREPHAQRCRSHLDSDPITAGSCRATVRTFTTGVDPGSPPQDAARSGGGNWWRRRALPPGPLRLFRTPFIAIVRCRTPQHIGSIVDFSTSPIGVVAGVLPPAGGVLLQSRRAERPFPRDVRLP